MNIANEKLDIIIQGGQSNSEGYGRGSVSEEYIPSSDILYMECEKTTEVINSGKPNEQLVITYLDKPFKFVIADERSDADGRIGDFALTFAQSYIKAGMLEEGRKLLIVRAAIGGTGFKKHHWGKGDYVYLKMLEMTDYIISQNKDNRIVAFLWHQGEHDAYECNPPDNYEQELSYLLSSVRERYGVMMPFVAGDFVGEWKNKNIDRCEPIVSKIKAVTKNAGNAAFVETADLVSNNQKTANGDDIHFCRESLHTLGRRYFEAYKEIIEK